MLCDRQRLFRGAPSKPCRVLVVRLDQLFDCAPLLFGFLVSDEEEVPEAELPLARAFSLLAPASSRSRAPKRSSASKPLRGVLQALASESGDVRPASTSALYSRRVSIAVRGWPATIVAAPKGVIPFSSGRFGSALSSHKRWTMLTSSRHASFWMGGISAVPVALRGSKVQISFRGAE